MKNNNQNYIMVNGIKYEISTEKAEELLKDFAFKGNKELGKVKVGDTFKIGEYEFIALEHTENGQTVAILKDLLVDNKEFGNNNNYNGSNVDKICNEFAQKLETLIGTENLCIHTVDLTSANGMTCYGKIERKVSLLTLENLRKYGNILCNYPLDEWWWLSTSVGTKKWGNETWVACVSPIGLVNFNYYCNYNGVRPFCVFSSNIFVS